MKLWSLLLISGVLAHSTTTPAESSKDKVKKTEQYPILKSSHLSPVPYSQKDTISLECIQRQIDTGEHKFGADGSIVYAPFPVCHETQKSLSFNYGVDSKFNCSFTLTDEIYHLFQLYIHEDSPLSCRVQNYALNGGNIPLTFALRGNLETSHLDIDTSLNVIGLIDSDKGVIGAVSAFGSGTVSKRYIIGDDITFEINNVWVDQKIEEGQSFTFKIALPIGTIITVGILASLVSAVFVIWLLYGTVNKKVLKLRQSNEFGIEKND